MRRKWFVVCAVLYGLFSSAFAQEGQFNKRILTLGGLNTTQINPNEPVLLRFIMRNVGTAPLTVSSFPDNFADVIGGSVNGSTVVDGDPVTAGIQPIVTNNGNCGTPTLTTNATGRTTNLTGVTVPAPSGAATFVECQVNVQISSPTVGVNKNVVPAGSVVSNGINGGTNGLIQEDVTIRSITLPTIDKGFGTISNSATRNVGTVTPLVIRIRNNDANAPINTVQVADTLPSQLTFNVPTNAVFGAGCGTPRNAVFAGQTVTLNVSSIAANTNCDVTINVVGNTAGVFNNTIGANAITTREGVTNNNIVSRTLTYQALDSFKSFSPNIVDRTTPPPGNSPTTESTMTLRISSVQSTPLSNVSLEDFFTVGGTSAGTPLNLEIAPTPNLTINPPSCGGTSTGLTLGATPTTTALAGAEALRVSGLTIPANGNCEITVRVRGKASAGSSSQQVLTNTLRGENIKIGPDQGVFVDRTADLTIVPQGVTGRVFNVTKDVTNDPAGVANYGALATISRDVANVPVNAKTGWYRIRFHPTANPTTGNWTNVAFTDDLPDAPSYGTTLGTDVLVTNCGGGTVTVNNTPNKTLTFSGGTFNTATINSGAPCEIKVRATSTTAGDFPNSVGAYAITNDQGGSNQTGSTATLRVVDPIALAKSFAPSTIGPGGITRVTVTLTNNDFTRPLTNVSLTDSLPAGLTIAAAPQPSTTCVDGAGNPVVVSATPTTGTSLGVTGVRLGQATQNPFAPFTCAFSVFAQSDTGITSLTNLIPAGDVTTAELVSNPTQASATLNRSGIVVSASKNFVEPIIDPGEVTQLEITLLNNSATQLTNVNLIDYFTKDGIPPISAPGCANPVASTRPSGCPNEYQIFDSVASTTCNGTVQSFNPNGTTTNNVVNGVVTVTPGGQQVQLTNGVIAPNGSCIITVNVTSVRGDTYVNTIPSNSPTNPPGGKTLTTAQGATNTQAVDATITVGQSLGMQKSFSPNPALGGQNSRLTIRILNGNGATATNLSVTDFFTTTGVSGAPLTGMVVATPPNASTTCTGATFAPVAGATSISLTNGSLNSGASCLIEVDVNANKTPTGSSNNTFVNTLINTNVTATAGAGTIRPRRPVTATLTTPPPPTVAKAFSPTRIEPNVPFRLTITLSNTNTTPAVLQQAFVDQMPTGIQIAPTPNIGGTCTNASISTTNTPTPAVTYASGASIPANGNCTIQVDVIAPNPLATAPTNTIPANALVTNLGNNPDPANASVTVRYPFDGFKSVRLTTDADNSGTITVGDTVTWSVFYKNTGSATQNAFQITDAIPATMLVTAGTQTVSRGIPPAALASAAIANPFFNGTSDTNLLTAGQSIAVNEVIRVDIPAVIQIGATSLSNQTDANATNVPAGNSSSDNIDAATTGLPAGVAAPAGSVAQTQLTGQNPTLAAVQATPTAQGWKFVEILTDADQSQSPTVLDTLRWTIFYKNTGTVNLTNVSIADTLPAGVTQVGSAQIARLTPPATAFTANANTALPTPAIATIVPNEVIRITIDTTIATAAAVTLNNQATLTAGNLPVAGITTDNTITGTVAGVTPPTNAINQPNTSAGNDQTQVTTVIPVSISGRVYNDVTNGGTRGTNPGIEGVTITLNVTPPAGGGAPYVLTRTTNASGDYSAIVPVGSNVTVVETQPGAFGNGTQNSTNSITINNITANQTNQDFGERTGAISGQVWQDNGASNGTFQTGTDTVLPNQCITLTGTDFGLDGVAGGTGLNADTTVTFSTRSDASGNYSFAPGATNIFPSVDCSGTAITSFPGLRRGTYSIEQRTQPANTADGITTAGAATTGGTAGTATALGVNNPDAVNTITLGAGQTSSGNNFAEVALSSLGGVVFQTNNNDNIQQAGEPGIGGVTMTLTGVDDLGRTISITTTTAAAAVAAGGTVVNNVSINGGAATPVNVTVPAGGLPVGGYLFGQLRPSNSSGYTVTETQPANFISTISNTAVGTGALTNGTAANNVISGTVLGSNQNSTGNNFGELPPATLAGRVFRTVADDNTFDVGDVGLGGETITLTGVDDNGRNISITTTTASAAVAAGGTVVNNVSINGGAPTAVNVTVPAGGVPVGGYFFGQLPASNASGYTVTETTQPALHSSTVTNTRNGNPASGTSANNAVSGIPVAYTNNLVNYDFGELQSDLSLTKTIDVPTPTIGQIVTFTITVTNNGFSNNSGVAVRDLLPNGYTYVSSTPAVGATLTRTTVAGGDQLDWTVGNLAASSSATLTVRATVNATGTRSNFAQVQSANVTDTDSQPGNNTTGVPAQDDEAAAAPTSVLAQPSISGFVYLDVNNDGTRAATGENGLGNPATNPAPTPVPTITLTGTDINGNPVSRTAIPDPTTGAWSITGLLPPQTATTYTLTETQPTNYTNRATTVGTGATANGTATSGTNTITGINLQGNQNGVNFNFGELLADVSIVKNGPATIQANQNGVVFTLVVTNNGPTQTTGVVVRDVLPAGYSFVSSTPAPTTIAGNVYDWNVGTLNAGQTVNIAVTVNVNAGVSATNSINFAQIQASDVLDPDSTPGNNNTNRNTAEDDDAENSPTISGLNSLTGRVYLDVNNNGVFDAGEPPLSGVEVQLTGTDINGAVVPQSAFTDANGVYTFTNLNDTPGTAGNPTSTGYTVTQVQPSTTTNRSTTAGDSSGTPNSTGGASSGGQVTNVQFIGTSSINYSEVNFGELRADLSLSKTVVNPAPPTEPQVGSNVTFRLTVTNSGETQTTGVVVQDVLPAGYSFVSSSSPSATNAGGTITWNVGTLDASGANSSRTVDIVATVVANRPAADYTNAAQVTASSVIDPDSQPNNGTTNGQDDTSNASTTPIPVADLRISKTDGITAPATINAGSVNTYTIVVTNDGPSNVTGAGVTDTLPNAFYATAGRQWRCVSGTNGATCPAGTTAFQNGDLSSNVNLNVGQTLTFEVRGTLLNPVNGTVSNTANIAAPNGVVDPTPSNNNATDSTPITPGDVIGVVFVDTNGNGTRDAGEPGIPNIDVVLTDVNGITTTVQTNASGQYTFLNIPAGAATVDVITSDPDFPAQHVQTAGTDPSPVAVVSGGTVAGGNPANAGFDGYQPQGNVTGVVFIDTNGNGTQDPGEAGIPNITVTLTDAFGTPFVTTTNSSGEYSFSSIPAGTANVVVDTADPDFPASHVQTAGTNPSPVNVVFGQTTNAGIDGFQPRGDVVGIVFLDTNGNGALDAGETRLPNIDVEITDAFGGVRTVQTNASGVYTALSVPAGTAQVNVVDSTLPAGLTQTAGVDSSSVNVLVNRLVSTNNPNDAGIDGYRRQGSVSGVVFIDTNGDGVQNPGEPGIPNVDVQITDAGGKVITVTTNASGQYTAPGVLEGTANVNIVDSTLPANLTQTAGTDSSSVNVVANQNNDAGFDGYRPQGNVFGRVFFDTNGNGTQDPDEPGLANVDVRITDSAGNVVTVTTNAAGDWVANNVLTGTATVDVVDSTLPANVTLTAGQDSSTVNVLPNVSNNAGFDGYRPQGNLTGRVFLDTNNNGVQDPGEAGIPNVDVRVTDSAGNAVVVRTNANGDWVANNVLTGNATVDVVDSTLPANVVLTTTGSDPNVVNVLPNVTTNAGLDGYRPQGNVFGRVFLDPNGNGVQDAGELGIPNVDVRVTDSAGNVVTVQTNATGDWVANNVLSGNATVDVVDSTLPAGVRLTTVGSDPNVVNVLPNISNNAGIDGYQQRGTITGFVWRDDDGDGVRDPNEPVFPGVQVTITDLSGNPVQVVTDANGQYTAPVAAGPVTVSYTTPNNHQLTTGNATQVVQVPPNGIGTAANVGYQPLFGGLTGRVFFDANNNGILDAGERGIAGVTVEITDSKGNVVRVVTDQNGEYSTTNLALAFGPATVRVIDPAGHLLTTGNNPQVVQVPAGSIGRVPNVGYVLPQIRLEKNVVVGGQVIPRDQAPTVVVGGTLNYQVRAINTGVIAVTNLTIIDTLPKGLTYVAGSSTRVGTGSIPNPTNSTNANGQTVLTWVLAPGTLAPNAEIAIRFGTIVTPLAANGDLLNVASATGNAGNGTTTVAVQSNASIAAVKVSLGVFAPRTTIVGRVYFDNNNNDSFERDTDEPVQGARVYLSDGRWSVTDNLGRYSIPEVAPGRYAVRLDPITAPFTCKRVPDDAPCTRFVVAPDTGGITIEDFLLNKPTGAAVKSVSNLVQRGVVTATKKLVQGGAGYAVTITIVLEKAVQNLTITDPLPRGSERGAATLTGAGVLVSSATGFALNGTVPAGTYTITYPLFTPLPPDLVVTDMDINYEEIFTLLPASLEVIR